MSFAEFLRADPEGARRQLNFIVKQITEKQEFVSIKSLVLALWCDVKRNGEYRQIFDPLAFSSDHQANSLRWLTNGATEQCRRIAKGIADAAPGAFLSSVEEVEQAEDEPPFRTRGSGIHCRHARIILVCAGPSDQHQEEMFTLLIAHKLEAITRPDITAILATSGNTAARALLRREYGFTG